MKLVGSSSPKSAVPNPRRSKLDVPRSQYVRLSAGRVALYASPVVWAWRRMIRTVWRPKIGLCSSAVFWHAARPSPLRASVLVPVTVPADDWIVNVASRLARNPEKYVSVPNTGEISVSCSIVCGVTETLPVSVKVPAYGPLATPVTE